MHSRMTTGGWLLLSKWRGDSVRIPNTEALDVKNDDKMRGEAEKPGGVG